MSSIVLRGPAILLTTALLLLNGKEELSPVNREKLRQAYLKVKQDLLKEDHSGLSFHLGQLESEPTFLGHALRVQQSMDRLELSPEAKGALDDLFNLLRDTDELTTKGKYALEEFYRDVCSGLPGSGVETVVGGEGTGDWLCFWC